MVRTIGIPVRDNSPARLTAAAGFAFRGALMGDLILGLDFKAKAEKELSAVRDAFGISVQPSPLPTRTGRNPKQLNG